MCTFPEIKNAGVADAQGRGEATGMKLTNRQGLSFLTQVFESCVRDMEFHPKRAMGSLWNIFGRKWMQEGEWEMH